MPDDDPIRAEIDRKAQLNVGQAIVRHLNKNPDGYDEEEREASLRSALWRITVGSHAGRMGL